MGHQKGAVNPSFNVIHPDPDPFIGSYMYGPLNHKYAV